MAWNENASIYDTLSQFNIRLTAAEAGGTPTPTPAPTLNALSLSPNIATTGNAYSGTITGSKTTGSTLALTGAGSPGLNLSGLSVTGTPTTAGAVNIVETLAGATNTPNASNGVLTVAAAGGSFVFTQQRDFTTFGSSSTAGNQDGTGTTYWTRMLSYVDNLNGKTLSNLGVGGATDTGVTAQVTGSSAAQKAADCVFQYGGNAFNSQGDEERHFAALQGAVTTIGHPRFLHWVTHNSPSEPFGGVTWARNKKLARDAQAAYPGKSLDTSYIFRYAPPADATDSANQALDVRPSSYAFDSGHVNQKGYNYGADNAFRGWAEALNGGIPFIAPYQKLRSTASTIQTNGGFVIDVPFVGGALDGSNSLTGVTAQAVGDSDYFVAVTAGAIRVTRASATVLTEDRRLLVIRLTKSGRTRDFPVFVSLAALDRIPRAVNFDGGVWMVNDNNFSNVVNGKQLSIVCDFQALGGDGVQQELVNTAGANGIVVRRLTSNFFRIFVKDAAAPTGTSVFSLTTTQAFATANGRRRLFFSCDTTTGVAIGKIVVDDTAAITAAPTTADLNLNLAGASSTAGVLIGANANGSGIINAAVSMLWMGAGYIDFAVQSNRDLFFDSTTKASLDLGPTGAVAGITPFCHIRGSAGDMWHGKNFGVGGDLICVDKGRLS